MQTGPTTTPGEDIEAQAAAAGFLLELLDGLPGVVVFIKDLGGRYVAANETLARRLGLPDVSSILGRTTGDLFPPPLGTRFLTQDLEVCRTGVTIRDLLELHLYPDRREGWCLTTKTPLRDARGAIIGLAGTSRDLHAPVVDEASMSDLAAAIGLIKESYGRPLRVREIAATARMSVYQLNRRIRALFGLAPAQLVIKTRIDAACGMLRGGDASIAKIAVACGYCDQSAFTRQFRSVVGIPPSQYRERHGRHPAGHVA